MPESPDVDEIANVGRVLSGDTEAFRPLVDRYQDGIFRLIVKQVGNDAIAEDLTQETFVRAFNGLNRFRADASFKTWITRIALNVSNSYFSSKLHKQRMTQIELRPESHDIPAQEYDPRTERDLKLLQLAMGRLGEKYRSVLALCMLEEKSYQEAAEILNIPAGTVGSRIHKALALLHREFWKIADDAA